MNQIGDSLLFEQPADVADYEVVFRNAQLCSLTVDWKATKEIRVSSKLWNNADRLLESLAQQDLFSFAVPRHDGVRMPQRIPFEIRKWWRIIFENVLPGKEDGWSLLSYAATQNLVRHQTPRLFVDKDKIVIQGSYVSSIEMEMIVPTQP